MKNNFLQYELWKDCNNHCAFCYNRKLKDIDKLFSLNYILHDIEKRSFDEIGFIGGEFFDDQLSDPKVKESFYQLFDKCKQAKKIYITSSLIYDNKKDLYEFLQYARQNRFLDKILLCTSYDTKYRFKAKADEISWKITMIWLHDVFPEMKTHTEIILSEDFMKKVLSEEFIPKDFEIKYFTKIDYIEANYGYGISYDNDLSDFLPDKSTTIAFLHKILKENLVNKYDFLNDELLADTLVFSYDGKFIEFSDRHKVDNETQMKNHNILSNKRLVDKDLRVKELFKQMISLE